MPKYTVGPITMEAAAQLDKVFAEAAAKGETYKFPYDMYDVQTLKRGDIVLTEFEKGKLSVARVTSVKGNFLGENTVRVSDGVYSWRPTSAAKLP